MNMGIGQQIKGMVRRAQHYWAELTEDPSQQQRRERRDQQEAVHERYGGVRGPGLEDSTDANRGVDMGSKEQRDAEALLRDRQENSQDKGRSDAELASPAARATRGTPRRRQQNP